MSPHRVFCHLVICYKTWTTRQNSSKQCHHIWTLYNLTLHRQQISWYTHACTQILSRMEETSWCLSRPQMPTSGGNGFTSGDKMDTYTHHIQSPAEAMGASVGPLFQSVHPDIIHSPPSVCLSLSLRCSEVCKIIHSSSLQSLSYLSDTHAHTQARNGFVHPPPPKNWGIGG